MYQKSSSPIVLIHFHCLLSNTTLFQFLFAHWIVLIFSLFPTITIIFSNCVMPSFSVQRATIRTKQAMIRLSAVVSHRGSIKDVPDMVYLRRRRVHEIDGIHSSVI